MDIVHPYHGVEKRLTASPEVVAYVGRVKKLPVRVYEKDLTKPYWKERKLSAAGGKTGPGIVPAGEYSDPDTAEAKAAVLGLYRHLKGQPITRHMVAVALNFRVSDDVDKIRTALRADGVTDLDPGDRGKSVRWIGEGATWQPPVKEKKADKAEAPVKKGADKPKVTKAADAPKGSRPAKKAAAAAKAAEAKVTEPVAPVSEEPVVAGAVAQ